MNRIFPWTRLASVKILTIEDNEELAKVNFYKEIEEQSGCKRSCGSDDCE